MLNKEIIIKLLSGGREESGHSMSRVHKDRNNKEGRKRIKNDIYKNNVERMGRR